MDIQNDENKDNPKFLAFQEIMQGNSFEAKYEAIKEFANYDCYESRGLLRKVAKRDDSPYVRSYAHQTCTHKLKMKTDPYKNPAKLIHHKKYNAIKNHIKILCKKLNITEAAQFDDKKIYNEFIRLYAEEYPVIWDLISQTV